MKAQRYCRILCLLLLVSCNLLFSPLNAQGDRGSFGRFELGLSFLELSDVNKALIDEEYNGLSNTLFALGGSWDGIHGKWVYGGKLYGYMISQSDLLNQVAILEYYYAQVHTGVVVYSEGQRWKLYPTVGMGWGTANLKTKPWSRQRPEPHLANGALLDFALNSRHYFAIDTEEKDDYMLELGMSVGYLQALGGQKMWQLDDFVPDEQLLVNPQGFYFRLSIGVGKFR
jgi:hypothetical protein